MNVNDDIADVFNTNIELSANDADELYNTYNYKGFSAGNVAKRIGEDLLFEIKKIPAGFMGYLGQGIQAFGKSIKETPEQARQMVDIAQKTANFITNTEGKELPKNIMPDGGVIFGGKTAVEIGDKISSLGESAVKSADRMYEQLNEEKRRYGTRLTGEEQGSKTYMYGSVAAQYVELLATALAAGPMAGLNLITAQTLSGEVEESLETYKEKHEGKKQAIIH